MFKRWIQLNKIPCLLIGPRRSGKTTFLKTEFKDFQYTTLDDLDLLQESKKDPKGFLSSLTDKVIIDEVQRNPQLSIAIKYEIDNLKKKYILTGSSSIHLLGQNTDSLAGRIRIQHMPTACFGENEGLPQKKILKDKQSSLTIKDANRKLKDFMIYGGFPEVVSTPNNKEKEEILKNYRNTYFTRDLAQLSNIENIDGLLAILNHLSLSICSHLETSNFARESGLNYLTTQKYLNVLLMSDLTFKLYGYHNGPAKKYIKAQKHYFSDTGILTSLNTRFSEGQLFENFVIAEIEKRRKLGYFDAEEMYYYKSSSGAEVDLIIETRKEVLAIEIKTTSRPTSKDIRGLIDFKLQKNDKILQKFLIYSGLEYKTIEDVVCIPVASFFCAM